jgi:hypothetical protein
MSILTNGDIRALNGMEEKSNNDMLIKLILSAQCNNIIGILEQYLLTHATDINNELLFNKRAEKLNKLCSKYGIHLDPNKIVVNKQDDDIIFLAAYMSRPDTVRFLINHGFKIKARTLSRKISNIIKNIDKIASTTRRMTEQDEQEIYGYDNLDFDVIDNCIADVERLREIQRIVDGKVSKSPSKSRSKSPSSATSKRKTIRKSLSKAARKLFGF